ncbi:MAG: hypothetical protein JNL60_00865 [Bacteroidia bacterium]|nr:hypothetical protein [Bacteroidia bacterium]
MRIFLLAFLLLISVFLLSTCKKHVPAKEAFLIKASDVKVRTKSGQGSGSHKITDLWLYVNGQYRGAYPVGNAMPIVSEGDNVTIDILAGIKNNGISDTRIPWSFYTALHFDTLVGTGKTIERAFTFEYKASTTFTWNENFESSLSLTRSSNSAKGVAQAATADCFEGKSGLLQLDGSDYYLQVESTFDFALPISSPDVYLELNYKCNTQFEIGLIGSSTELKSAMVLNPQESWNKIYIQLATAVSTPPTSTSYKIYFKMQKSDTDSETKKVFLDNIKLVYF